MNARIDLPHHVAFIQDGEDCITAQLTETGIFFVTNTKTTRGKPIKHVTEVKWADLLEKSKGQRQFKLE